MVYLIKENFLIRFCDDGKILVGYLSKSQKWIVCSEIFYFYKASPFYETYHSLQKGFVCSNIIAKLFRY